VGNVAASQLAVAHFHLGHALCDVAEAGAEGGDGRAEAVAGRRHRSLKITLPVRSRRPLTAKGGANPSTKRRVRGSWSLASPSRSNSLN
jgi:hypothetical protein